MPAGLTITNSWGTVQIDESWRNYGFRNKFSASITDHGVSPPNPAGYQGNTYGFTTPGTQALLVACRATQLFPMKMHQYFDGTSWTFNWVFQAEFTGSSVTEDVEFFIFDAMDSSYSNVGLEIFTSTGARAFHSDAAVMKVGNEDGGGVQGCDTAFTGTSGRIYAPLIMQNPVCGVSLGFPFGNRIFLHCLRASGSNIETQFRGPGAFGASGVYTNAGLYAAIDVTGL